MGGRGASSSYVYNKIESSFKDFIREKKELPFSFTLPNMKDRKQHDIAFKTINENYKASKEEQNIIKEIRLIKDDDGIERLYYQGGNRDVTGFSKSAVNGMKKWMAFTYIKRKR